jgi:hypothetical protein
VREAFFNNESETEAVTNLSEQITNNYRLTRTRMPKRTPCFRVLPISVLIPTKLPRAPLLNCFRIVQVASERSRAGNQIGEIRVFSWYIERQTNTVCPFTAGVPVLL